MRRFTLLAAIPALAAAQNAPLPTDPGALAAAIATIKTDNAWTLSKQVALCEIPAPPFKEKARGEAYRREMIAIGYPDTKIDSIGNVIAEYKGGDGPTVVLAGHLDTVFPEGTKVKVQRDGERLKTPGIADDCRGLAVVLATARAVKRHKVPFQGRILFVGNVGEEGPGNLRGVRYLLGTEYKGKVDYFISVDGTGGSLTSRAVGSNRYKVHFEGPGGHSFGAFGMPNPIHAMGRAIATISEMPVPTTPKATFNVGVVSGGTSVNSIAFEGVMEVDMRSESAAEVARMDAYVRKAIDDAVTAEKKRWPNSTKALTVRIDTIGIRPTGGQGDDAPIVRAALETARQVGFSPTTGASSTDSNYPISLGIPAVTIGGGGRSSDAHSLTEWYEDGPNGYLGPQWAMRLLWSLAGKKPVQGVVP